MYCTDYSIHLQCKLGEKPVQPSNLVFTFLAIVTPRRSRKFRKRSPDFLPGRSKKMSHHIHGINFMSLRNSCPSIHDNLAEWWASQARLSQCPQVTLSCIQLNQIKFSGPGGESPTACHTIFKPKCFDTLTLELQKIFTEKPIKWGLQQDSVEVFLRVPAGGCNARVLWLQNDKDVRTKQQSLV